MRCHARRSGRTETIETIETPFSTTAAEDAKRFGKVVSRYVRACAIPPRQNRTSAPASRLLMRKRHCASNQLPGFVRVRDFCGWLNRREIFPQIEPKLLASPALLERIQVTWPYRDRRPHQ